MSDAEHWEMHSPSIGEPGYRAPLGGAGWDFDIARAPKGKTVVNTRLVTDKNSDSGHSPRSIETFEADHIIAASTCGKVTRSYWIPKEGRWCMFTKENPPIAWMPWPEHPSKAQPSPNKEGE